MLARLRDHLTYANVVSTMCLFIVLGGGAYAAVQLPPKSVGTKQLKNKAVKRVKIAGKAVTRPKLAPDSVNGAKVAANALTGADVDESTLGRVPEARHATAANDPRVLFGRANGAATSPQSVLEWKSAHIEVLTDGDADGSVQARVRNTNAPGGPGLTAIMPSGGTDSLSPGETSGEYPPAAGTGPIQFVVSTSTGDQILWVRCVVLPAPSLQCIGERSQPD